MFDVFYSGSKPNLFAHECEAQSIEHAQQLCRTRYFWWISYLSDYDTFDFDYEPVPWQSEFTHTWPSQHHDYSGTYLVPAVGEIKYHFHKNIVPNKSLPAEFDLLTTADFDYTWHPHPMDQPFIYVFGNQWHSAEIMPTVEYTVTGATERKYMTEPRARLPERHCNRWHTLIDCEWDYSWVPDPGDPPFIYVFGNQHWSAEKMPTLEYHVPGATEAKYMDRPHAQLLPDRASWTVPPDIDGTEVDYSWVPDPGNPPLIYQFGTQHQRTGGPVYTVPGATEVKYINFPQATKTSVDSFWSVPDGIDTDTFDWTWHPDTTEVAYIYQFGTQWQQTGGPVYTVPGATEVKYVSHPRAIKTSTDSCWTVPAGVDTDTFDWTWHPDAAEKAYIYQFGTQHQRTGGPVYSILGATEVKYVDQIRITNNKESVAIYEIDHLDGHARQMPNVVKTVRYFDNYRDTLIRLAKSIGPEHEWVWVCSSICDYAGFDFSWHPEQWQATMLHVFPSNDQKFGDTFYMHVPTFAERAEKKALLEWYDVNFVDYIVPRRPLPVIEHMGDSNVEAVKTAEWSGPLALFTANGMPVTVPAVNLWRAETKTITPLSAGASAVIVPRVALPYIKTQLYDYPYIDKKQQRRHGDKNLDIVFISNGEANADVNYSALLDSRYNRNNLIHRVDNVKGRVAAYHAAARKSATPWFFAVFAKLRVEPNFNWDWQPDRMQQPKHYIFHAENTVNGLVYGHQAMIAYNRDLVLANSGHGLDFTLDSAHEVVPVLSGRAYYQETPWMCWRTAFREVLKLRASLPNVENEYRLKQWLVHEDAFEYSHLGAEDAVEYYESVKGNPTELRKSYEWDWLASYAFVKRSLVPDQQ